MQIRRELWPPQIAAFLSLVSDRPDLSAEVFLPQFEKGPHPARAANGRGRQVAVQRHSLKEAAAATQRTCRAAVRCQLWRRIKKKAISTRRKAPNKRKHMMTARAEEEVATLPVPMTIAEEPPWRLPLAFWPLEVMKW